MPVLRVALDLPLYRLFDYGANSASTADIGFRVRVPFGRSEKIGVIIDVVVESDWPKDQIKMAGEILRDLPRCPLIFSSYANLRVPTIRLHLARLSFRHCLSDLSVSIRRFGAMPVSKQSKLPYSHRC
jgi:hypothetical protein